MVDDTAPSGVPDGYLRDGQGRLVPVANVKPEHMLEDDLVRQLHAEGARRSAELAAFKEQAFAEVGALLDVLASKHGAGKGGEKGNISLSSYDGSLRVTIAVGDQLAFGPELQAAKALIDSCLTRWSEGADPNIRAVIDCAFDVGKEGKLRVDRILGLRRLAIDDDEWKRAMEAIGDALRVTSSTRYVRLHRRLPEGGFKQVPLDIARA